MFKNKVLTLINEYHIKKNSLADLTGMTRVTFDKKLSNNTFDELEKKVILNKYGALLQ